MNYLTCIIAGVTATAVMDVWGVARKPLLGIPVADYRFVGRWVAHVARGTFRHAAIGKSQPVAGEQITGWAAHYLLGLAFAAVYLLLVGPDSIARPTLAPALAFGVASVLVPFVIMQPAMGQGIAASRTPRPMAARLQSLVTHTIFGLGLYLGGLAATFLHTLGD